MIRRAFWLVALLLSNRSGPNSREVARALEALYVGPVHRDEVVYNQFRVVPVELLRSEFTQVSR